MARLPPAQVHFGLLVGVLSSSTFPQKFAHMTPTLLFYSAFPTGQSCYIVPIFGKDLTSTWLWASPLVLYVRHLYFLSYDSSNHLTLLDEPFVVRLLTRTRGRVNRNQKHPEFHPLRAISLCRLIPPPSQADYASHRPANTFFCYPFHNTHQGF